MIQFLSDAVSEGSIPTGLLQFTPSLERLTKTPASSPVRRSIGNEAMSHVEWAASKATAGSLTLSNGLPGCTTRVMPGKKPAVQLAPPSREVAKLMSEDPAEKKRPL